MRAVQGDDHRLVSAGAEGTVSVWDLRSGQELFQIYGHYGGIRSLQFDREGLITDGERSGAGQGRAGLRGFRNTFRGAYQHKKKCDRFVGLVEWDGIE